MSLADPMRHVLRTIGRLMTVDEPVLIAPRGEHYHRAPIVIAIRSDVGIWLDYPVCKSRAERYVAVDRDFAVLLERRPCDRCWPDGEPDREDPLEDQTT